MIYEIVIILKLLIKEEEINMTEEALFYKEQYQKLYNDIRIALGEERFLQSRNECLNNNNQSTHIFLTNAIEKLRDEAGDFET